MERDEKAKAKKAKKEAEEALKKAAEKGRRKYKG